MPTKLEIFLVEALSRIIILTQKSLLENLEKGTS